MRITEVHRYILNFFPEKLVSRYQPKRHILKAISEFLSLQLNQLVQVAVLFQLPDQFLRIVALLLSNSRLRLHTMW